MKVRAALVTVTLVWLSSQSACGPKPAPPAPPVAEETPADEIRRIGVTWQAMSEARGIQSAPAPVSVFKTIVSSTIVLQPGQSTIPERLVADEELELRAGGVFRCHAEGEVQAKVSYGRRNGEAAIQLERPEVVLQRRCDPPSFPDPELTVPGSAARFVLRGDRLVAVEPPLEKREYIPIN